MEGWEGEVAGVWGGLAYLETCGGEIFVHGLVHPDDSGDFFVRPAGWYWLGG